jgi:ferrochelatase
VKRFLTFVTSGFSCYSGCRQYREDMRARTGELGEGAPVSDKIRVYYNHPLFIDVQRGTGSRPRNACPPTCARAR